ncbi:complement resistance protein TraT [Arsukibacterium sp.]|uniref:complement resistance protein TraT n=1 Tax=Arsukibacterium sp. TaxID=1977258 RepID=UPI00299EA75F|nr:complement resistance protein TraT [Arsukibacterium sp.]MDX1536816.1 complement resistance protein TraT [Arsukibacterium sp.]
MRWLMCLLLLLPLTGCMALHTSVAKGKLDVQTRMSETIYLDPVEPELRTIFLDIRQTAAEYQLPLADDVRDLLLSRGYQLVDSPQQAQYWLQVNVRTVLKERPEVVLASGEYNMSPEQIHQLLYPGIPYEDPHLQAVAVQRRARNVAIYADASYGTDIDGKDIARALVVLAAWAGAEYVGNQLVKDKYYTMLTDIQLAEKIAPDSIGRVQESSRQQLQQGDSGNTELLWELATDRRKYQVKVVSFANKANLSWQDAEQPLHQGLLRSLAGIF